MTTIQVAGKRKSFYGGSEREVKKKHDEFLKRLHAGSGKIVSSGTKTVNDLIDHYLKVIKPTAKPRQYQTVEGLMNRYVRGEIGTMRLSRIQTIHIQSLITGLEERMLKRAPSQTYGVLRRIFTVGMGWQWIDRNPCLGVVLGVYHSRTKTVWTREEQSRFLENIVDQKHGLILWFILATGCRISDAVGLRWSDIDQENRLVTFRRSVHRIDGNWVVTEPKTEAGKRKLTIPSDLLEAIVNEVHKRRENVKGEVVDEVVFVADRAPYLHERIVLDALERRITRLKLPKLTVHGLRHQNASFLLSKGVALPTVSKRLGHANPAITARIYSHAVGEDDQKAADAFS